MANVLTDEEDELTQDEEQRRLAAQQTIGSMPRPNTSPPQTLHASMPPPDVGATSPPANPTISEVAPYNPPAPPPPRPESRAFTDWQAQDLAKHPVDQPRYHGLARAADTIAQMTWPGQAAEVGGEMGTLGAQAKSRRLAGNAAEENTQIKYGEEERGEEAKLEGEQAKTATEKTGSEVQQIPLPGGGTAGVMTSKIGAPTSAIINSQSREDVQGLKNTGAAGVEGQKEAFGSDLEKAKTNLANAQADLAKFRANPNSPMYRVAMEHLKIAEGDYALKLKEFGFNYEPSTLSPEEQATMPTDQAGNVVGLHSPLKPSAQTTNAAQRANNVVSQIPRLTQEITDLQAQLGPGVGRWNRFWQGDVGVADPKFAHLSDDMDFMASAVALAHAYGRLPTSISEKFDKMYQAGKQDPANMLAAMQVAGEWLPKIAKGGQTAGEQGSPAAPNATGGPANPTGPQKFGDFRKQQFGGQ
jgi:hypothetical protein